MGLGNASHDTTHYYVDLLHKHIIFESSLLRDLTRLASYSMLIKTTRAKQGLSDILCQSSVRLPHSAFIQWETVKRVEINTRSKFG